MISIVQLEANITCYRTPQTDTFQAHRWFCPTGSWRREAGSSCSQACSLRSEKFTLIIIMNARTEHGTASARVG